MKKESFFIKLKKKVKPIFSKSNFSVVKYLPKTLGKTEKIIIFILLFAILISGLMIWYKSWLKNTHLEPTYGGTFTEGIVGEAKDLDKHTARLTNAGLTRITENGEIKGDLAESWEILDDGKTYQFKLRPGFSSVDFASLIANKNLWSNIDITSPADDLLTFKFKQPFSPFLSVSTEPIFPYGPYHITKEEKDKITLEVNENYWQGKPYLEKIIINLYPDKDTLYKAAKKNEITGYLKATKDDYQMDDSKVLEMSLPRELNLFFNLNKEALKNVDIRKKLRDNQSLNQEINLDLVTSENEENMQMAEKIKGEWQNLKVNLVVKKYNNIELQKDIIPKREYDILLYGQDYGPDPDPYPFWHSSQAKADGMNLSNYTNKKADKLLEEARQSFDTNTRNQKYEEFRKILDQDVPYINVKKETCYYVISNNIQGLNKIFGSSEADRFLNINQWYIKTKRVKN